MPGFSPLGITLIPAPVHGAVRRLREWPVSSQLQARRNALVASTACAQRRAERQDVADYLDRLAGQTAVVTTTVRHVEHTEHTAHAARAAQAARAAHA